MIFDKEKNTSIVHQEKIPIATFLENLEKGYGQIKNDSIIIDLFSFEELSAADILEFLHISNRHKEKGKSFVIVTNKVGYDEIPEEITVTPTIQEARDIIEMEEIERDLGI